MEPVYLLRVLLPDRPGVLGAMASALGAVDADIASVDVVERRDDASVVDDILVDLPPGRMADALVSACHAVTGARVEFVRRYPAGAGLHRDLEAVEAMTGEPPAAEQILVRLAPEVFRADWSLVVVREGASGLAQVRASEAAPGVEGVDAHWLPVAHPRRLPDTAGWARAWRETAVAAAGMGGRAGDADRAIVVGRRGGPEFLDSELARLGHLVGLARTISAGNG